MTAVPSNTDGYHTARGGDTLDAFAPLTHRAQQQVTEQAPHWITIASSFVRPDGEAVERVRLMQAKNKDQMRRGE
jgi:hypothetical protein